MYDITRFSLADMTRCGAALRRIGEDPTSMEEVADSDIANFESDNW